MRCDSKTPESVPPNTRIWAALQRMRVMDTTRGLAVGAARRWDTVEAAPTEGAAPSQGTPRVGRGPCARSVFSARSPWSSGRETG